MSGNGMGIDGGSRHVGSTPASSAGGPGANSASQARAAAASIPSPSTSAPTSFDAGNAPGHATASRVVPNHVQLHAPGLARVALPPRTQDDPYVPPRKAAYPMTAPRDVGGGGSPIAPGTVASAAAGVNSLIAGGDGEAGSIQAAVDERAARAAREGAEQMPSRHGLVAFAANPRGETIWLEQERWQDHILQHHAYDAPTARGKRMTTYWPVRFALGSPSMSERDVLGVIMDGVRKGHWQNAPRDTRLSVYELPADEAARFGVSEIKVSAAPDGRILSAYPARGSNVLAVRELNDEEQAEIQQLQAAAQAEAAQAAEDGDERMFRTNVADTQFG